MSAFYDIWIGTTKPTHVRSGNAVWKKVGENMGCFLSFPEKNPCIFVNQCSIENYTLIVLGQFYEVVDLRSLINSCVRFAEGNDVHFDEPAGHYMLFLSDHRSKEWYVFTNRFGTYHAYWLNDGTEKAIGTYFLGMAQQSAKKTPDWEGIAGFFGMGFFPDTKTYLREVQILAPASYYHFDASLNRIGSKRYWNWNCTQSYAEKEHDDLVSNAIHNSLEHAVKGYRVALPVSGGLDSRMLAGIMTEKPILSSLWAYSYGYKEKSIENIIAKKIAKTRNMRYQCKAVPNYLFEQLPDITEAVELFQYVDGTRQACMQQELATNADLVVGGHWGDVWMDDMGLNTQRDLVGAFDKKILKRGRQWLLSEVTGQFVPDAESYLREYFTTAIRQYAHLESASLQFKAFKTDQWSFRWTLASIRMYQSAAFPVLPFYDKNVADLLLAIPQERLLGRRMQVDFIKKHHPDLARITWQEYGRNLYSYKYFNNRNMVYRIAKKMQRAMTRERVITRNWEIFYMHPEGRKNLEAQLLDSRLLNDFIAREKVKILINNLYKNPSGANGYAVSMLLTFNEALKRIFN